MTDYEKDRNEAAEKEINDNGLYDLPDGPFIKCFKIGADWSQARAEKRIQELELKLKACDESEKVYIKKIQSLEARNKELWTEIERLRRALERTDCDCIPIDWHNDELGVAEFCVRCKALTESKARFGEIERGEK